MQNAAGESISCDGANSNWTPLVTSRYSLCGETSLEEALNALRAWNEEFVAVVADERPIGLCSRKMIGVLMSSQYGHSVYARKPVAKFLMSEALIIRQGTTWEEGVQQVLSRPDDCFFDDVIVVNESGCFIGQIHVRALVNVQSDLLAQKTRRLEADIAHRLKTEEEMRVTVRRLNEVLEQLQCSQDQVIQRERLSALGQMATGIAHDFNNALTPILGYSDLIIMRPEILKDRERILHLVKVVNTAASDAAQVVCRLREFYRPRDADEALKKVDLNAVIAQAILLTQPRWKDQARVAGVNIAVVHEKKPVPIIRANEGELRELLMNLVFNAVDAMPSGGEIVLSTTCCGNNVLVEVRDNGTGMSAEVRRRCMEPFYTTKGSHGTGLGLALVFGIVKRHEGDIEINSEWGHGTSVIVRLPFNVQTHESSSRIRSVSVPRAPLRILIVDDELNVRDVIHRLLSGDGNTIATAENGIEALAKFKTEEFDVVVTDRSMPEMNGDQLALEIKRISPSTPVVMLTGFGAFMNARGEHPEGVDLVVSKPVRYDDLRSAIERVLAKAPETLVAAP